MRSDIQKLREALRTYIRKVIKENEKADAEWVVDKVLTAVAAATNNKKDYQYAAALDSDKLKSVAQDIKSEKGSQTDEQLMETFFDWLASGARKYVHGIIDRRAGYLQQALKDDPKLQQMARNAGISSKDFEGKIYNLMKSDTKFLQALATQRFRR